MVDCERTQLENVGMCVVGRAAVECAVGCGDRGANSMWTKKSNEFWNSS